MTLKISQVRFETKMISKNAVDKINVVNRDKVEVFIKETVTPSTSNLTLLSFFSITLIFNFLTTS